MLKLMDGAAVERASAALDAPGTSVHLIGIGGAGMSGAADLLLEGGAQVAGSDLAGFTGMGALVSRGARVSVGHRAEQLDARAQLVVISAAIPESNPELAAARARGLPVIKYAQLLGLLMQRREKGVAIAGTHGKSTTTALCAHVFRHAGLAPSFLMGAWSDQLGGSSGAGDGPHFIAEACEYDRSFLHLAPESAVILNIEPDHLDCYRDLNEIVDAFAGFTAGVDPDGLMVCNMDDEWAMKVAAASRAPVVTFGFAPTADFRAVGLRADRGCFAFDVYLQGQALLSTKLPWPGQYSVTNALAVVALAHHAGAAAGDISEALSTFAGIHRRLTWRGEGQGVTIVDDYAHHPTELRLTIEAARSHYAPKRTVVVFQPHQHERTRRFMREFAESFQDVDEVIVPDIFGAREATGTTGAQELAQRICDGGGSARYLPGFQEVADHVVSRARAGDLVLTMGAGDVWKVADELVARLCRSDRT